VSDVTATTGPLSRLRALDLADEKGVYATKLWPISPPTPSKSSRRSAIRPAVSARSSTMW
jgi:hypothetical protein